MNRLTFRKSGHMGHDAPRIVRERALDAEAIFGTWDFKWAAGSRIRVAFQFPRWLDPASETHRETFRKVAVSIRAAAEQWSGANIGFDWFGLEPGVMPSLVFAHFDDAETGRSHAELGRGAVQSGRGEYDVLVSLDRLSTDGRSHHGSGSRFALPSAELGTYNRRADYGVPTVYLGPLAAFGALDPALPPEEYYAAKGAPNRLQRLARFHMAHEFGHVLGLIHAHQDPRRKLNLYDGISWPWSSEVLQTLEPKLVNVLAGRLRLDEQYLRTEAKSLVESHIAGEWPGNSQFSNWSTATGPSVMTVPYLHCLVGGGSGLTNCPECESVEYLPQGPAAGDLQQLRELYPMR